MTLSPKDREIWQTRGYLVLRGAVDPSLVAGVNQAVDERLHAVSRRDAFIARRPTLDRLRQGTSRLERARSELLRRVLRRVPQSRWWTEPMVASETQYARIRDKLWQRGHADWTSMLFRREATVRAVAFCAGIAHPVAALLDDTPVLFFSSHFARGGQFHAHVDSFASDATETATFIGCWVALESVSPDAGPLYVVPGSHRMSGDERARARKWRRTYRGCRPARGGR